MHKLYLSQLAKSPSAGVYFWQHGTVLVPN